MLIGVIRCCGVCVGGGCGRCTLVSLQSNYWSVGAKFVSGIFNGVAVSISVNKRSVVCLGGVLKGAV